MVRTRRRVRDSIKTRVPEAKRSVTRRDENRNILMSYKRMTFFSGVYDVGKSTLSVTMRILWYASECETEDGEKRAE